MHFQYIERFLCWLEGLVNTHGWFTFGGFIAGCLFVGIFLGFFSYRRFRKVQRIAALAEERNLDSLDVEGYLTRVRITRSDTNKRSPRGFALQAPAVRASGKLFNTVQVENGILTYLFPENDPAYPEGIQFSTKATWVVGDPIAVTMPIDITPVTVPKAGNWYPAIVDTRTGVSHPRSKSRWRKYWLHGYRNLFVGDFVAKGDPIGIIQPQNRLHRVHTVYAPESGFILQFGALPFTPLAEQAIVMLLGTPHDMRELTYQGDYAGFLGEPESGPKNLVGRVVEAGAPLGMVTYLMGSIHEPVVAPIRLRIVRQHINYGDAVHYKETLFTYIPV